MTDDTKSLIGIGMQAGAELLGIAGKALAGLFRSPEEIRQALLEASNKLAAFVQAGGEMDQRRDAARAKTDKAIAEEEEKTQP